MLRDTDFTMMQNTHNSFITEVVDDYYDDSDVREANDAAFVFRTMEKELMSDMLPLFIKTPNGRHRCGIKRECYKVNPMMVNSDWMKCYQFIGALIGRNMIKDHLWFGMPLAPTFWMLSKDEKPTLKDYAKEDARLQKRLNKFAADDFEEEFWVWTDSADEVLPLIEDGKDIAVTSENLADFQAALLDKLIGEGAEQTENMKKGIAHTLGDMDYLREYLNWHDVMVLAET